MIHHIQIPDKEANLRNYLIEDGKSILEKVDKIIHDAKEAIDNQCQPQSE